jgi:hypothetical protein
MGTIRFVGNALGCAMVARKANTRESVGLSVAAGQGIPHGRFGAPTKATTPDVRPD